MEDKDKIIEELKAENEKLKALCDTYKTCYQAKHSDIKCLFIKYKQTLQEIKEIAEKLYYTDLCENKKSLDEILDEVHEILQKINGAEEE